MKIIKMGLDYSADAFSFCLIATAQMAMIIRDEYSDRVKFEHFYQQYKIINKAIEMTIEKLQMIPNNERRTQIITLLHGTMEKYWNEIRENKTN